jgi:hypothetical protein
MPSMWKARDYRDDGNALLGCGFFLLMVALVLVVAVFRWLI